LTGLLAEQEPVLSRLEITWATMTEILSGDGAVAEPAAVAASVAGKPDQPGVAAWAAATYNGAADGLCPAPKPSSPSAPSSATATSRSTGSFTPHMERERLYPQPDQHNHELHT
jgi:hypothetical protein